MKTDDIRDFLKNNYHYDGKKIKLKNGENAVVDIASISSSSNAPHVKPPARIIEGIDEPFYFLCGETETPTTSNLRNALNNEKDNSGNPLYINDDYIVAIELYIQPKNTETLRQFNFPEVIKAIKEDYSIGIYRKNRKANDLKNSYFLVLIRIKEKGIYTTEYLDRYFASSDSRTYHDLKYTIAQFKTTNVVNIAPIDTTDWPKNLLVFGAPGTGKSYSIDEKIMQLGWRNTMQRVTFYEDYSYEKFIGAYVPTKGQKNTEIKGKISKQDVNLNTEGEGIVYKFVPGVFLKMIADAWFSMWLGEEQNYVLVIEEINRANAASVFGDMFQLLDRNKDGESEYIISLQEEMRDWLRRYLIEKINFIDVDEEYHEQLQYNINNLSNEFRLPVNLYLWATMNSADQGVFPLDSAFKRRWSYMYKSVNDSRVDNNRYVYTYVKNGLETNPYFVSWDALRTAINKTMGNPENNIEEDRFIGAWYFKADEMHQIFNYTKAIQLEERNISILSNPLCDKLFHYLRQDVFRNNPGAIFKEEYQSLYKVREGMMEKKALQDILNIELSPESYKNIDDISFILSTKMTTDISLRDLKKESKSKSWEITDDFFIDINMTYNKSEGTASEDEIDQLIKETISIIELEIKKDHEDGNAAVKDFEDWIRNKETSDTNSVNQLGNG